MCATFQAFPAAAGLFGILATAAFAQDMNVNRQVREGKGPTADGGMTLGEKDSVSFDARGNMVKQSAGFWKGLPGKLYTVALIDPKTGNSVAIVEFQGTLRWNASGRVGQMLDEFQARNIKTMSSKDQWLEVKSFVVEDGRLRIAATDGETFLIDGFSPYFQAQIATTAVVR